jgi:hypothetical protein
MSSLQFNTSLKQLYLGHNKFGGEAGEIFRKYMSKCLTNSMTVEVIKTTVYWIMKLFFYSTLCMLHSKSQTTPIIKNSLNTCILSSFHIYETKNWCDGTI